MLLMRWWRFVERTLPPEIFFLTRLLMEQGFACYLVGGAPRDLMLHIPPKDWDLATDALPETVEEIFKDAAGDQVMKTVSTGKKYGTIKVLFKNLSLEVTTFRREGGYTDGRHPDWVEFTPGIEDDLSRRDFTINAMAINPVERRLVDPFNGQKDLKRRIIKTVGDPAERFREDALRMLRFYRFQAELGFRGETATVKAIRPQLLAVISKERIREELTKILLSPQPRAGLMGLKTAGLLAFIAPEFLRVLEEDEIFAHLVRTVEAIAPLPHLRWAAFLHDIGKGECKTRDEEGLHFYGHAEVGQRLAGALLDRLRFSSRFKERVLSLVRRHMFSADPGVTDAALRRLALGVGEENLRDLVELRRADIIATGSGYHRAWPGFSAFSSRVEAFLSQEKVFTVKDLVVKGDEIMKFLNIPSGPQVGRVLDELFFWVTADPTRNNRQDLYSYLQERYGRKEED